MKIGLCKKLVFAACLVTSFAAYGQGTEGHVNPFLSEFNTPYGVPPSGQITIEDYREGFLKGMEEYEKRGLDTPAPLKRDKE